MVVIWKTTTGNYRVQTSCPETHRKLRNRKRMTLAGMGINEDLWIYAFSTGRPSEAIKMIQTITGQTLSKRRLEGLFVSKNAAI